MKYAVLCQNTPAYHHTNVTNYMHKSHYILIIFTNIFIDPMQHAMPFILASSNLFIGKLTDLSPLHPEQPTFVCLRIYLKLKKACMHCYACYLNMSSSIKRKFLTIHIVLLNTWEKFSLMMHVKYEYEEKPLECNKDKYYRMYNEQ